MLPGEGTLGPNNELRGKGRKLIPHKLYSSGRVESGAQRKQFVNTLVSLGVQMRDLSTATGCCR